MSEPDAPPVPTRKQTLAVINQDLAVQLRALGVVAHDVGTNKYICQLDKKLDKKCRQMERKCYLYAHYTSHVEKDEWGDLTSDAKEKLKAALASTSMSLAHLTAPSAAPPKHTRKAAAVARGKAAMEMHAATAQDDPVANVVDSVRRLFELKAHEQLKIIGHIFDMMKARTLPAEDVDGAAEEGHHLGAAQVHSRGSGVRQAPADPCGDAACELRHAGGGCSADDARGAASRPSRSWAARPSPSPPCRAKRRTAKSAGLRTAWTRRAMTS